MLKLQLVPRMHERLAHHLRPKSAVAGTEAYELAGRFAALFTLAGAFLPFFVIEFWITEYLPAAVAMAIAGAAMMSAFVIFKMTGSAAAAREVFLCALFCFLVWENFFFKTLYSPGLVWFAALPVVSILLGSVRSGATWLLAGFSFLALHYFWWHNAGRSGPPLLGDFSTLFVVSAGGVSLAIFLFVVMVDAARKEAIRKLVAANDTHRQMAERDELTGLFNRRALYQRLGAMLQDVHAKSVIAMIIDLDGFKDVNDTYGHEAGDAVIQQVSTRLSRLCSEHLAVLARLGGDEFAILMVSNNPHEVAQKFAQCALNLITGPLEVKGKDVLLGMSIGAAFQQNNTDATEVMRRADMAMYEAKQQGGNRLCCYVERMDAQRSSRLIVAAELAEAISSGKMEVHYQPIVDAVTRRITGVEALARWSANGRKVPPDVFIPIAEESGLVHRLGQFVLEVACRDAASWGSLTLSVNLSPVQFRNPNLVKDILEVLRRTAFPPARLELEVTEGYLIQHRDRALPIIEALRSEGISIALDDFGSGYSSIGYLRQYPFDRLKIDKAIVQGMNGDSSSRSIIQATALLASNLSAKVTAEGVETEEQARLLRLAGCSSLQGFLFARPAPAADIDLLLTRPASVPAAIA